MIHYHGTPIGGRDVDAASFLAGRHALVPFTYQANMAIVAEVCKSFVLDNGAFTVWRKGGQLDVIGYAIWVDLWAHHPGFEWAIIPDVIDGDESANDSMLDEWDKTTVARYGVPVWHLHESNERLVRLCGQYRTVALGSSGKWAQPGTTGWWQRMETAMDAICDKQGRPMAKLHGLRMLDPDIFTRLPLSSADSTNAGRNNGSVERFGMYPPPTAGQRATVIADRIEAHNSAPIWRRLPVQQELLV